MGQLKILLVVLVIYLHRGWYYETDRPVVIVNDVLVFADTKEPVPKKEKCRT